MTAIPEDPIAVRPAKPDDVPSIGRITVRAWQHAYRGLVPDAHLDALDEARSASRCQAWLDTGNEILVAELAATVVGFCLLLPSRDPDAPAATGEVVMLYVSPEHARRGAGRALLRASVAWALGRFRALTLWVLSDNHAARRFYEACGFGDDGSRKHVVLGGGPAGGGTLQD